MNVSETSTALIPYQIALMDVWLAISHDVLTAMEVTSISREEVIDIILDAERVEQHGGMTQQQMRVWNAQSVESQRKLAEQVFWEPVYQ